VYKPMTHTLTTLAIADPDTNLALIAILGTVVASLFALLNYLLKRSDKTIQANTNAGTKQADATLELSKAVASLNISIVERDAQDRAFHTEVMRQFETIGENFVSLSGKADRNFNAITAKIVNVDTMNVKNENVEKKNT